MKVKVKTKAEIISCWSCKKTFEPTWVEKWNDDGVVVDSWSACLCPKCGEENVPGEAE